jgi:hypothetical protein
MTFAAVAVGLGVLVATQGFAGEQATPAKVASKRFAPGLVASADHLRSARAARLVGADVVRVEFDVGTRPHAMRRAVAAIARAGARPLLLAGFHGRMPTAAEARNLGRWAKAYGPGARFWRKRPPARRHPVRQIEFGNETSYRDQYGDTWSDSSYVERAELYAVRFAQAHAAIRASRRPVGLLAQADDGGTGSRNWVSHMFSAVPRLARMVDGWTVHPYGPRAGWQPKLHRLIRQTAAQGAGPRIPIDVTEYGLSSDDGSALSDNYGWPSDQSYGQAAAALASTVAGMRSDPSIGPRLRLFMVYAAHDLSAPRSGGDRERYFGVLRSDLSPKGAYTTEVRRLLRR